ncbi:flagellar hook protein FlgE [Halopseudomonas pertucinogena]|uniref:Flagellar hook protein FlgE n=1 Tax=Halopseudomonas pertucinogena TaxID=86175 RepID=A0ABQ2CLC0_9GAMM|nr:flagellar hook protein FlgE [Halopseudomonas pertucinogena]GGI92818.1 flagellar hook protein FlgE [Halopseudomonas pertucinogena]
MSFNIGLSGIRAASSDLNITGNNIANASTVGFKSARAEFGDVYAASILGTGSNAQGSGVVLNNVAQIFTQGNINYTENSLDLAINGNGFFVTSNNGALSYTRAGYFGTDREGFIVNNLGGRLQGYGVNAVTGRINEGVPTDLRVDTRAANPNRTSVINSTLNLNSSSVRPVAAQNTYDSTYAQAYRDHLVDIGADPDAPTAEQRAAADGIAAAAARTAANTTAVANFDPSDSSTYNSSTSVTVYDSLGNSHVMSKYFIKTDANTWDMHVLIDGRNLAGVAATDPEFSSEPYQLRFNAAGALVAGQTTTIPEWRPLDANGQPAGAELQELTLDLTGSSQYASGFGVTSVVQDGYTTGELAGLEIDDQGMLIARYTNGQTKTQGQLVLATFANQQGLKPLGDTAWAQSSASGEPVVGAPGSGTLGMVQSGALEQSNVDLSEMLINLIVAQRNYQANAKTIQTEDAVTQTIINLR